MGYQKIQTLRDQLYQQFPERQRVIDGSLAAILSGEHVLILGPPGTAKSALARAIANAFSCSYFERMLTKFSTPDELFGPISLKKLEDDRFLRVTTGMLPEAEIAFVDEVFKANSAILNSMLTLMNERMFHNDGAPQACPLVTLFGASNEIPESRELEAMHDRFLARFDVQPIAQLSNLKQVMFSADPQISAMVALAELRQAQQDAMAVEISDKVFDALVQIRDLCRAEGVVASDRRWKKSLKLVRATAFMEGRDAAQVEDLQILADSLWREPRDRSKVLRLVGQVADPISANAVEIVEAAREVAQKLVGSKTEDRSKMVAKITKAIDALDDQVKQLDLLWRDASPRTKDRVADCLREVRGFRAEAQRMVTEALGINQNGSRMGAVVDHR